MQSSCSSSAVSTGNRVAQFIVITAFFSFLYAIFMDPATAKCLSAASSLGVGSNTSEDLRRFTMSKIPGLLLFLALLGLLQHKKKQVEKTHIGPEQTQTASKVPGLNIWLTTPSLKAPGVSVTTLPRDVLYNLLLFLSPKELATCPMVCRAWDENVGNTAETLWRHVFQRDFGETGDRFANVFPIECWRQFYFRHHLSRAVELARLLQVTDGRKCVAIRGQVYDVTDFLELHPGGPHVIGDAVGTDATVIWDQFQHSKEAKKSMQQFLVLDNVLAMPASKKLHGNLETAMIQWHKTSWALAHSHYFGRMTMRVADAVYHFHSRRVTTSKNGEVQVT